MRAIFFIISLGAVISLSAQSSELAPYDPVFEEALKTDKHVILVFSHEFCSWCRIFDRYHTDPEVKEILDPEYVIHKIDILESETGKKLFRHYHLSGTPVWMIFNSDKELLADGKDDSGRIVGYPYTQVEIAEYLSCIRETSRNIGDPQLEVLRQKLQEYGDK